MSDTVASRQERLSAALQRLNDAADADEIERHVFAINLTMLNVHAARRAKGFDIGIDEHGEAFAKPRTKTAGPARELRDLVAKCRKAIAGKITTQDWTTVWAAQPRRIRSLWPKRLIKYFEISKGKLERFQTIDRSTIAHGFIAPSGYGIIAPKPEIVLPVIEAELARITAAPNQKTREGNAAETAAIEAIRNAYRAITGNEGGRVIKEGKLVGRLARLGREIDAIYGTNLFARVDSRRLR